MIIDDEKSVCLSLSEILQEYGYTTFFCLDPHLALSKLTNETINLVLLDIRMPKVSGVELLRKIKQISPETAVIIISGYASVEDAVKAMRYGAVNLYQKPIDISKLIDEIKQLHEATLKIKMLATHLVYESPLPCMKSLKEKVEKVAPTPATVLITGESGTGKEVIARMIHALSGKEEKPLVTVNCAAIPDTLLESYMFGHEKGSFTDAKEQHKGIFETAGDGTVFLDEIGDMSLESQSKLLRVLQEHTFSRIGGTTQLESKARVIAATNSDLLNAINNKEFRADLFYRLSVITLRIPPLRERREDIIPMAHHFLSFYNANYQSKVKFLSDEVQALLYTHSWPGNVRELKNLMERLCIFCTGDTVQLSDLPEQYYNPASNNNGALVSKYDEMTRNILIEAMELSKGVKVNAAKMLGIDRKTLNTKLRKFGIE
jgi:DNA-binding NtrC family response regulator